MESSCVRGLNVALHGCCISCKGKYSYHMGESGVMTRWPDYIPDEKQLDVMCFLIGYLRKIATSLHVVLYSGVRKPEAHHKDSQINPNCGTFYWKKKKKPPELFQNVSAVKDKKMWLRNCLRRKDTKETWQLNALHDAGLDPIRGNKTQ